MARITPTASATTSYTAPAPSGGDDTAALSAAMDAANAAGKPLLLQAGTYTTDRITKSYALQIIGVPGRTFVTVANTVTNGWLWTFQGSIGSHVSTTVNVAQGDVTINAPTAGIAAGDIILIGSNALVRDEDGAVLPRYVGQLAEVLSITSASALKIVGNAYTAFLTSDSAFIARLSTADNLCVRDVKFLNPNTLNNTTGFIFGKYLRDVDIDIAGDQASAAGVQLQSCFKGSIRSNGRAYRSNGTTVFGYGVLVSAATCHMRVETTLRNGGTSAFNTSGFDNDWGEPIDIRVTGASVGDSGGFTTHPAGRDISFEGCHVTGALGPAFGVRCNGARIVDCTADRCSSWVSLYDNAQNVEIINNQFRDEIPNTGAFHAGKGINYTQNSANPVGPLNIRIAGNKFVNASQMAIGLNCNSGSLNGFEITDNTFTNCGTAQGGAGAQCAIGVYAPATRIRVLRNAFEDTQGTPTTQQAVYFSSAASFGVVEDNVIRDGIALTNTSANSTVTFGRNHLGTSTAAAKVFRVLAVTSGTLDLSKTQHFQLTLSAASTTLVFSNPTDGMELTLQLVQDATGGRTVTWPASVKWPFGTAPSLQSSANAIDQFRLVYNATLSAWLPGSATTGGVYPWQAQDLKGWSHDGVGNASAGIAPTTQNTVLARVLVPEAVTITNVVADVTVAGATLTAGTQNVGVIYDSSGNLLAQTVDQATAWTTTGAKVMALTAPITVAGGRGVYIYVGVLSGGTTIPFFSRGNGPAAAGSSPFRYGRVSTVVTAPASTITLGSMVSGNAFWFAIS